MNNQALAHMWAYQEKKSGKGNNMFFEGDTIYSYGHHFPIATHYHENGRRFVLLTTRGYSNTTAKHINHVRAAISHMTVIKCDSPATYHGNASHGINIDEFKRHAKQLQVEIGLARQGTKKRQGLESDLADLFDNAADYTNCFKLPAITFDKIDDSIIESLRAARKERNAEKLAEKKEREAFLKLTQAEKIEKWRNCEPCGQLPYALPTMLRIKGAVIETSRNAHVNIDDVKELLPVIIMRMHKTVKALKSIKLVKPIKLGIYDLTNILADGTIVVGCHHIPQNEVLLIAQQLGVTA